MNTINFFKEDIDFDLRRLKKHKPWLKQVANLHDYQIIELNYIFCSDEYLHKINLEYLSHDTYTDIITFDMRDTLKENTVEGDVFISIERVKANAADRQISATEELERVMAHGLLHLIGFKDKAKAEKENMRKAEDSALKLL